MRWPPVMTRLWRSGIACSARAMIRYGVVTLPTASARCPHLYVVFRSKRGECLVCDPADPARRSCHLGRRGCLLVSCLAAVSTARFYWESHINLYNAADVSIPAALPSSAGLDSSRREDADGTGSALCRALASLSLAQRISAGDPAEWSAVRTGTHESAERFTRAGKARPATELGSSRRRPTWRR